jgi:hypothetical protein
MQQAADAMARAATANDTARMAVLQGEMEDAQYAMLAAQYPPVAKKCGASPGKRPTLGSKDAQPREADVQRIAQAGGMTRYQLGLMRERVAAWLLSDGAWAALRASRDLLYTSTLTRLHLLPAMASLRAPCLAYSTRSGWRRLGSRTWNRVLVRSTASLPVVRLGLHPDDADDPAVRHSWQRCLARLLEDRRAATKEEFARAWAASLHGSSAPAHVATPPAFETS